MNAHTVTHWMGERAKLVIAFDYSKGRPGCRTRSNGDPGWPEEPEEVEVTDVRVWTRADTSAPWVDTGVSLPEEVTDNAAIEAMCWERIEREREDAQAAFEDREHA